MSAARNYRNRIYLKSSLKLNEQVELSDYHFNYLIRVLRLKAGDTLCVFNEHDGEWLAEVDGVSKKAAHIKVCEFLKTAPAATGKLTLIFAPIKNPNASFYIQKATELGVGVIVPILTKHTIVRTLKSDKLEQIAIEAAEQCERFSVPEIKPLMSLMDLDKLDVARIFFCDETEKTTNILTALAKKNNNDAILIGPEGGFDSIEREYLQSLPNTIPVTLGHNILRAETAMVVALGCYNIAAK